MRKQRDELKINTNKKTSWDLREGKKRGGSAQERKEKKKG